MPSGNLACLYDGAAWMKSVKRKGECDVVRNILHMALGILALDDDVSDITTSSDTYVVER